MPRSITDEELDGVAVGRLVKALERRTLVLLVAAHVKDTSPEANCRQWILVKPKHELEAMGMASLMVHDMSVGCRQQLFHSGGGAVSE